MNHLSGDPIIRPQFSESQEFVDGSRLKKLIGLPSGSRKQHGATAPGRVLGLLQPVGHEGAPSSAGRQPNSCMGENGSPAPIDRRFSSSMSTMSTGSVNVSTPHFRHLENDHQVRSEGRRSCHQTINDQRSSLNGKFAEIAGIEPIDLWLLLYDGRLPLISLCCH